MHRMKVDYKEFKKGEVVEPFDEVLISSEWTYAVMSKINPMDVVMVPRGILLSIFP